MAKDRDYRKMINTSRWRRLRKAILSEQPVCWRCSAEGRLSFSTEVHHRVPVETGRTVGDKEALMFNPDNLVGLCHDCHVRTHMEMGRSGREVTKARNAARTAADIERIYGTTHN